MEAAVVCLEQQGHRSGATMEVTVSESVGTSGSATDDLAERRSEWFEVIWNPSSDQMRRSHADLPEATERGACGIAFLLVLELTDYTIIERSFKSTGVDYGLGYRDQLPWVNSARLEISGTLAGRGGVVGARVREKLLQVERFQRRLPAYIIVVAFDAPSAEVVRKA